MDIDFINFIRKTIKTQLFAVYDDYYVEEHEILTKFFENVINESISKSVLLIGPRGVGKTKVILKNNFFYLKIHPFLTYFNFK